MGPSKIEFVWDYLQAKRIIDMYGPPFDMINSPFAFPRLPPRANSPLGIAGTGKIKEAIIHDNDAMMDKLSRHASMLQSHASGLFNMAPNQLTPGHPLYRRMHAFDMLEAENQRLLKENAVLKNDKVKDKKK